MFHIDLSFTLVYIYLIAVCTIGLIYGYFNWKSVTDIKTDKSIRFGDDEPERKNLREEEIDSMNETSQKISEVKF